MITVSQYELPATAAKLDLAGLGVIIPTLNAASHWPGLQAAVDAQGIAPEQVFVIDSSSADGTRLLAARAGYTVFCIPQREFSHGGTRQLALWHLPWARYLLYLTQDAIPASRSSFARLFAEFDDPKVGAAYGRQLPREGADPIERHARLFNYPAQSQHRSLASRSELGIKAAFLSNSFAAYRRSALEQVGGFPSDVIMAEDSVVAARLLLAGWKVAYSAEATVIHSHPLSLRGEFSRYFDTGVHHARERWLCEQFGKAEGEGWRFLQSEARYLLANGTSSLPRAGVRAVSKLCAYRLGLLEGHLPFLLKRRLSAHPGFWAAEHEADHKSY